MELCDAKLRISTSHYPQTDGLSEIMNPLVENYLRYYCSLNQTKWDTLLPSAEFAFSSSLLDTTGYTSFELDIRWTSRSPLNTIRPKLATDVPAANALHDNFLSFLSVVKCAHEMAQARQSAHNSEKDRPHSHKVCNFMWLDKLYFADAVDEAQISQKRSSKRLGSCKVLVFIRNNAIRIEPPDLFVLTTLFTLSLLSLIIFNHQTKIRIRLNRPSSTPISMANKRLKLNLLSHTDGENGDRNSWHLLRIPQYTRLSGNP